MPLLAEKGVVKKDLFMNNGRKDGVKNQGVVV